MSVVEKQERSLAEAVAVLVEAIHQSFPMVTIRPLPPYEDEDFALARRVEHAHDHPAGPAHGRRRALRLSRGGSRHGAVTIPRTALFSPWTSVQLGHPPS